MVTEFTNRISAGLGRWNGIVLAVALGFALVGCEGPPRRIILDNTPTAPIAPEREKRRPGDPDPLPAIYDRKPVSVQYGKASYYYGRWIGRKTANGEIYRATDVTAAHRTLPFNTMVRVTNLSNGRSVIVRINNRGPYVKGRIVDLSLEAAKQIDMTKAGVVSVRVEVLRKIDVIDRSNLRAKRPPPTPTPTPTPQARSTAEPSQSDEATTATPGTRRQPGRRR